jgi:hypothetical protein
MNGFQQTVTLYHGFAGAAPDLQDLCRNSRMLMVAKGVTRAEMVSLHAELCV